jgi:phosphoglycolate phosphatase-like HAD superfamily hydrolase
MSHVHKKMKEYLIAFDSDGCVFDAMEPKHRKCFVPASIEVFGFHEFEREFTELWCKINLYSKTRGINRFLALEIALDTMREMGKDVVDTRQFKQWIIQTKALSAAALAEHVEKGPAGPELKIINEWSSEVNRRIKGISGDIAPYGSAPEIIRLIAGKADVAVVTSANYDAIREEWGKYNLLDCVTELCGQERGTKKECLGFLKNKGYKSVLMVGDAEGDLAAAEANGCLFYPIITGREEWSWTQLKGHVLTDFLNDQYLSDNQYFKEFEKEILCK